MPRRSKSRLGDLWSRHRGQMRLLKRTALFLTAGFVFGGLNCVMTAADLIGTGLTVTSATGLLGPASPGTNALGAGLDVISDLVKYTPFGG